MGKSNNSSRHNRVDRLAIERRGIEQARIDASMREIEVDKTARARRALETQRSRIQKLQIEIPKALKRLEEQGWPDADIVAAGIIKYKRFRTRSFTEKSPVLCDITERAAWRVASTSGAAGSGDLDSGLAALPSSSTTYWLLSTGQIGREQPGLKSPKPGLYFEKPVSICDIDKLCNPTTDNHIQGTTPVIRQIIFGIESLGRPDTFDNSF
jgi:hypothetical protein